MQQPASGIEHTSTALTFALSRPADLRVLAVAAGAAVLTDLAVRSGVTALAGTLLVVFAAAGLLWSRPVTNLQARALVAAAPLFGMWLLVRASPWLIPLDILAAAGLLVLGASFANGGSVLDLTIPRAIGRSLHAAGHGVAAPQFLVGPLGGLARRVGAGPVRGARARAILRGAALAVPVLVVLGLLLASADAVFASLFRLEMDVDPTTIAAHTALLVAGAWAMAGLCRLSSAESAGRPAPVPWRLGPVEATVVLASVIGLFGAFAVAQLVSLSAGGRRVIETAGLTYAEYARSGFFQLLWVAGITLCLLLALRAGTDLRQESTGRRFLLLSEAVVGLTLVIVAVAVWRMHLYQRVFGLTMLRLYVEVFSYWIGVVFVLLGGSLAGLWARRAWLLPAAAAAGLVILLGLNVVNPEAVVVRHNVTHAERSGRFDPAYLADLSSDAVPTLLEQLPRLEAADRSSVLSALCPPEPLRFRGWAAYNVSLDVAFEKLVEACPSAGRA
jgi:hypothetical protein